MGKRRNLSFVVADPAIFAAVPALAATQIARLEGLMGLQLSSLQLLELERSRERYTHFVRWQRDAIPNSLIVLQAARRERSARQLRHLIERRTIASTVVTLAIARATGITPVEQCVRLAREEASAANELARWARLRHLGIDLGCANPFQGLVCDVARLFTECGLSVSTRKDQAFLRDGSDRISSFVAFVGQLLHDMPRDVRTHKGSRDTLEEWEYGKLSVKVWRALRRTRPYWDDAELGMRRLFSAPPELAPYLAKRTIAGAELGWWR
jgi:hypothetical protein